MFDMIKVKVDRDVDILGRVNARSHFRYVVEKQVSEQVSLSDIFRRRFGRCVQ